MAAHVIADSIRTGHTALVEEALLAVASVEVLKPEEDVAARGRPWWSAPGVGSGDDGARSSELLEQAQTSGTRRLLAVVAPRPESVARRYSGTRRQTLH